MECPEGKWVKELGVARMNPDGGWPKHFEPPWSYNLYRKIAIANTTPTFQNRPYNRKPTTGRHASPPLVDYKPDELLTKEEMMKIRQERYPKGR